MENITSQLSENNIETQVLSTKIYSSGAIMGFSIFFSAIFGGVLLMQNLKDLDKKKEANFILGISIAYTIVSVILINLIATGTLFFNIAGGLLLSKYYFSQHIPNEEKYPKKQIWKPLIISIIITIPFVLALIYSN